MATPEQYAQWIVANKAKKGTPEFETVARAYQATRSGKSQRTLDDYKAMSAPGPAVDPTEGMSGGGKFMAGVGMGMTRLGRGVGQAVGLVDQSQIDEAHALEAPLEQTGAGKAGNIAGTVAALVPTAFIPGANTLGGAALIGAGTGAVATEGGLKERAMSAAGGAVGGAGGIAVGRGISRGLQASGSAAGRVAGQNAVKNQTIAAARQAGYVLPPSEMAQTGVGRFAARAAEGVAGKAAMGQQASVANQRVTNNLVRRDLGIPGEGQISAAEIEAVRRPLFAVYDEAARVSPTSRDAVQAWREANNAAKMHGLHYSRSFDPRAQQAAQAASQDADTYFQVIQHEAATSGRPELAQQLADARIGLARIGTAERALNDATGDVSARELAKALDKGVPLRGGMREAGRFAQGFDRYAQSPKTTTLPGVSKLDFVLGAGGMVPFGVPGLALAAAPALTRNALLSRPVQALASPRANPGANRLAVANALRRNEALAGVTGNALSRR